MAHSGVIREKQSAEKLKADKQFSEKKAHLRQDLTSAGSKLLE